jgi:hypothetical protein
MAGRFAKAISIDEKIVLHRTVSVNSAGSLQATWETA